MFLPRSTGTFLPHLTITWFRAVPTTFLPRSKWTWFLECSCHVPATFILNRVLEHSCHVRATYQKNVPVTFQNVRDFLTFLSRSCHVQIECGLRTFLPHSKRTFLSCFQTRDFGTFLCHVPVTLKFNVVWERSFHIKKNIPVTSPQKWFWNVALTHSYHVHKGRDVGTFPPHSKKALL